MIKLNLENTFIDEEEILEYLPKVAEIHDKIHYLSEQEDNFLGWVKWPYEYDEKEFRQMHDVAIKLRSKIDVLIVIGIGGSYLGSRAAIDMINGLYSNDDNLEILYVGNTISSTYTKQVYDYVSNKKFGICVISKSGTTLEPAIAFELFKNLLEDKYGSEEAKQLIVAITDKEKGLLKSTAVENGYQTFTIPDNIGGRFSVLTPVGVFVMLMANINVNQVFRGAQQAYDDCLSNNLKNNNAYQYAITRYHLYKKYGYKVEMLVSYEMQLQMIAEWWKQLFGESEGKEHKGLLPTSALFSTDLHSLGQFIQDGTKNLLFETIIKVKQPKLDINLDFAKDNENFKFLQDKSLHEVNLTALQGVLKAHSQEGQVPNILLEFETMDDVMFGYLSYWFMKACAMSAYLLEINPFDQPGVEIYKKNMFALLGK